MVVDPESQDGKKIGERAKKLSFTEVLAKDSIIGNNVPLSLLK